MIEYPKEITPEVLENSNHITSEQVTIDIADVKKDITNLENEIIDLSLIARLTSGPDKRVKLNEMRSLVLFLEALLEKRASNKWR